MEGHECPYPEWTQYKKKKKMKGKVEEGIITTRKFKVKNEEQRMQSKKHSQS